MDNLLGGLFFKCSECKVLTKVNHRETTSSDQQETINNIFHQANDFNNDLRMLFQKDVDMEESIPLKNLFQHNSANCTNI